MACDASSASSLGFRHLKNLQMWNEYTWNSKINLLPSEIIMKENLNFHLNLAIQNVRSFILTFHVSIFNLSMLSSRSWSRCASEAQLLRGGPNEKFWWTNIAFLSSTNSTNNLFYWFGWFWCHFYRNRAPILNFSSTCISDRISRVLPQTDGRDDRIPSSSFIPEMKRWKDFDEMKTNEYWSK